MVVGLGRSGVWLAVHLTEQDDRDEAFTVIDVRTLDQAESTEFKGTES